MEGFNWVISALASMFGLLNTPILGIPFFVFPMVAFLFTMLAKFIHGRK